jgi:hypothetical protein
MKKETDKALTIIIPKETYDMVRSYAYLNDVKITQAVRECLADYLQEYLKNNQMKNEN